MAHELVYIPLPRLERLTEYEYYMTALYERHKALCIPKHDVILKLNQTGMVIGMYMTKRVADSRKLQYDIVLTEQTTNTDTE